MQMKFANRWNKALLNHLARASIVAVCKRQPILAARFNMFRQIAKSRVHAQRS
jgi:hypothetical protein